MKEINMVKLGEDLVYVLPQNILVSSSCLCGCPELVIQEGPKQPQKTWQSPRNDGKQFP